jgi:hypothetical protein
MAGAASGAGSTLTLVLRDVRDAEIGLAWGLDGTASKRFPSGKGRGAQAGRRSLLCFLLYKDAALRRLSRRSLLYGSFLCCALSCCAFLYARCAFGWSFHEKPPSRCKQRKVADPTIETSLRQLQWDTLTDGIL